MPLTIDLAHDISCPWCWIALSQTKRLSKQFDVQFNWLGFELWPEELGWPPPAPPAPERDPDRPIVPTRIELAYAAEGLEKTRAIRPSKMRTLNAMQAIEFAKDLGRQDEMVEALYNAYWLEGKRVSDPVVLRELSAGIVPDPDALVKAVEERQLKDRIVPYDNEAYAAGVYNVPTYWIGGRRYAEQPYPVLARAIERELGK